MNRVEQKPLVQAADYLPLLKGISTRRQECFYVFTLDSGMRLIRRRLVFKGSLTSVLAHPREVFAAALHDRAACVTVAHNHPSGDPTPSSEDIAVSQQLVGAGVLMGVRVSDHIIIARGGQYFSFRERGML